MKEEESVSTRNPRRFGVQLILLAIILVGFPAGSWYYLQKGLDYQRGIQADLTELGTLTPFELQILQGKDIDFEYLENKVLIAAYLDANQSKSDGQIGEILFQLHDQFDDRDDVLFLIHSNKTSGTIDTYLDKHQFSDPDQCFFLSVEGEQEFQQKYFLPNELSASETIAVTDIKKMVRRHYNINQPKDLKLLVEHITLLFPRQAEKDLIFKRETEK